MSDEALKLLLDKQQIYEVIVRYARGADRFDMELYRSCFHPDATMIFENLFQGDAEEVFRRVEEFQSGLDGTMHIIANHLADVRGDVAFAETYVNAYHWGTPRDDTTKNFITGSRYVDRFERRDGEWRIARRITLRGFVREEAGFIIREAESGTPHGSRDRADPSYWRDESLPGQD